jgi:hypothetical protein
MPDLQHWVMFFIYTRTGAAPSLIPPAGGGGVFDGFTGAERRSVVADATALSGDSIALHIDERPSSTYTANYDNVSLTDVALGLAGLAGGALSELMGKVTGTAAKNMIQKIGAGVVAGTAIAGRPALGELGLRLNPFKRVYFDQMNFRNFEFRYRFLPKSPAESNNVFNLIKLFKFHMHPESQGATNLFHIFPDEFEILYYYGTRENTYWHKISRCVLTDLKVDYGGENFSSFPNGVPSEIYLNMNFQETEILDKARIESGY